MWKDSAEVTQLWDSSSAPRKKNWPGNLIIDATVYTYRDALQQLKIKYRQTDKPEKNLSQPIHFYAERLLAELTTMVMVDPISNVGKFGQIIACVCICLVRLDNCICVSKVLHIFSVFCR